MDSYVTKEDLFSQYGKSNFSLRTKAYFINKLINSGKISKISNDKYKVVNHVYKERYSSEKAVDDASKVILLVAGILTNTDIFKVKIEEQGLITNTKYKESIFKRRLMLNHLIDVYLLLIYLIKYVISSP